MVKYDKGYWPYVGEILREERTKRKLSLQDISDKIGGVKSKQSLMRYENGQNKIDDGTLEEVCRVMNLNKDDIEMDARMRWLTKEYKYESFGPEQMEKLMVYITMLGDPLKDYLELNEEHQRQVRDMIQFLLSQEQQPG